MPYNEAPPSTTIKKFKKTKNKTNTKKQIPVPFGKPDLLSPNKDRLRSF
jgi:hypothetical protein